MDREGYIRALVRFAEKFNPASTANDARRTKYIAHLVSFAATLRVDNRNVVDAGVAFNRVLKPNARDILWRVAGATLERWRQLPLSSHGALRTLEMGPDLLGPLGYSRTEVAHASALVFFLDATRSGELGRECLSAFTELVIDSRDDHAAQALPDLTAVRVTSERDLGRWGRVDISIDGPRALIFVEVKVDAKEGKNQLWRYMELARFSGQRTLLRSVST